MGEQAGGDVSRKPRAEITGITVESFYAPQTYFPLSSLGTTSMTREMQFSMRQEAHTISDTSYQSDRELWRRS